MFRIYGPGEWCSPIIMSSSAWLMVTLSKKQDACEQQGGYGYVVCILYTHSEKEKKVLISMQDRGGWAGLVSC